MSVQLSYKGFSDNDQRAFEPAMKIGLLATIDPQGLPHLTLLSSLKAGSDRTVTFGQFIEGRSKQYVRQNPKTAFLIMTLEKQLWRGKACWKSSATSGPDFDWYNNVPMFRYNAYLGIHTVHTLDLVGHTGQHALPVSAFTLAAIQTLLARSLSKRSFGTQVLNPWTQAFFNKLDNLKFLAFVDIDGYPWIIPAIQAQAQGGRRIVFSTSVYPAELKQIPVGSPAAVLGLALSMEDVLVRGKYTGLQRQAGVACGGIEIDWVYNPMPPAPGQIYPSVELKPVTEF